MANGLCYKPRGSIGHKADAPVPAGRRLRPLARPGARSARSTPTGSTTTGTGSGTTATATSATRASTRWTSPAGAWASPSSPSPCRLRAAGSATTTTARPRTPSWSPSSTTTASCSSRSAACRRTTRPASASATSSTAPRGSWRSPATRPGTPSSGPRWRKGPAGSGGGDHFANFIQAVKSRDAKSLSADIEEGHLSSAYCHLGNIAYRLGRKLQINPSTESFVNDSEADTHLTRAYRAPFVVPTQV